MSAPTVGIIWRWIRIKDLPDRTKCPRCGSLAIGMLKVEEEKALPLIEKRGEKLAKDEEKMRCKRVKPLS